MVTVLARDIIPPFRIQYDISDIYLCHAEINMRSYFLVNVDTYTLILWMISREFNGKSKLGHDM